MYIIPMPQQKFSLTTVSIIGKTFGTWRFMEYNESIINMQECRALLQSVIGNFKILIGTSLSMK